MVFSHMWVPDFKRVRFWTAGFQTQNTAHFQVQFTVTATVNWWQTRELKPESQFSFHSYFSGTSAILFLFTKADPFTVGKKHLTIP